DLGFRMGLSRAVPDVLARHLEPAVDRLLLGNGLRREDVAAWAVHPGGPRILRTVEEALQLPPRSPAGVPAGVGRLRQLLVRDRAAGAGEAAARRWSTSWAARARARFRS